ncbi:hypothetical protein PGSY75_0611300 [Plasmodium gaboni]|uniref:Uncharacterized protein n=1 Tax=Plasmodium gaboni TaxID=647221 RepID=A0A151LRN5_9APIC|nr:hypothetical protein PGSY75_0611300 [Plasmodium gaboni]KYO01809.1 hypothetical protein PGSY75_0611300 [Plasmodium gaboni]SOV12237.1 conserved Plasmodium protein, unknown function [Plasmodium gaboni]SOV21623.1 conserved Plasmodium protein, unknown function [Plasmodium sp. DRC-Itaito]
MFRLNNVRLFLKSKIRFSGGKQHPKWVVKDKEKYNIFTYDNSYYGENFRYNNFILHLRSYKYYIDYIIENIYRTLKNCATFFFNPIKNFILKHNPDIRYQLVALMAFFGTTSAITCYHNNIYQNIIDVTNMLELGVVDDMKENNFFDTQSELQNKNIDDYSQDHERLTNLWEMALKDATQKNSFNQLCKFLTIKDDEPIVSFKPKYIWRYNMIPYGENNPDTKTFAIPASEKPFRSFALNFTYNNLSGNWGDYIDRRDNKGSLLRPSRYMFTDVLIPATK